MVGSCLRQNIVNIYLLDQLMRQNIINKFVASCDGPQVIFLKKNQLSNGQLLFWTFQKYKLIKYMIKL